MNEIDQSTLPAGAAASLGEGLDFSRVKSIEGVDVGGKRVLMRADLNVPMQGCEVADTTRIKRVLPTIRMLLDGGAKVIVLSHLGRPQRGPTPETSLQPIAAKLQELLPDIKVHFVNDCIGDVARRRVETLAQGEVAVLENLRYHRGEVENDPEFAKSLGELGDIYVDDAFSSAHRAHASIDAITDILPAYAGLLMMTEVKALERALEHPERPVMAIVGGSKISTKIKVLTNLLARMDLLVITGGMASTILKAQGFEIGKSLCEVEALPVAKDIMGRAKESSCEVVLPLDVVVAKELKPGVDSWACEIGEIPADAMILDIGPKTVADLKRRLGEVRTLLWNGPVGAFEVPPFGEGTFALARDVARLTQGGKLVSVAGGGDTVAALKASGAAEDLTYVSTAGGAFLEWLGGADLPAVVALARAAKF